MTDFPAFTQTVPLMATWLCALGVSVLLVLTKQQHGHLTMDSIIGVQKFHTEPTPRVGGIGIYVGLITACLLAPNSGVRHIIWTILLAGFPALAFGLLEDLTKVIGVRARLGATLSCGVLGWLLTGIALNRLDVPGLDQLLVLTPVAVFVTTFAAAGIANAINIIDGLHGLASGTTIIAVLAIAAIAGRAGDAELTLACVLVAAAICGFGLVNYPWGKLFLGDGGAYFVGFALAWVAVLLPVRNPGVSPWASMLVCAYPVIEVLYSVMRRRSRRQPVGAADNRHLHSLIKTQFIRKKFPAAKIGNAAVSPMLWGFAALPALAAVALSSNSGLLMAACLVCALLYHVLYVCLAGEESPVPTTRAARL